MCFDILYLTFYIIVVPFTLKDVKEILNILSERLIPALVHLCCVKRAKGTNRSCENLPFSQGRISLLSTALTSPVEMVCWGKDEWGLQAIE